MAKDHRDDDYDWLFSDEQQRNQARRDSAQALPPHSLPPPNLPPPGKSTHQPQQRPAPANPVRRPKQTGRRLKLPNIRLILIAWLALLVAMPFIAWAQITKVDATPVGNRPAEQGGRTYVLVGSDALPGTTGWGLADSIMLLTTGSGPTVLTSVPRDSLVDVPGLGRTKINAAYSSGGPPLLVQTLEQNTGVRIEGFVQIGFTGLVDVVDAIGGIEICPATALQDRDSQLDIEAGCQDVDGETALAYSRNRKAHATGDIARGQAQREVIGAIGSSARSPWTVINPWRYVRTATSVSDALSVDDEMSLFSFVRFGWSLSGAMSGSGLNCTVPIQDMQVSWDRENALAYFGHLRAGTTDQLGALCTADGFV